MRKLFAVLIALALTFVVFLRVTRKDYQEIMLAKTNQVLADLEQLEGLFGEDQEMREFTTVARILGSWVDLEWDTDPAHLQVPPVFAGVHRIGWWDSVIVSLTSIKEKMRVPPYDKEAIKEAISGAKVEVTVFQVALEQSAS